MRYDSPMSSYSSDSVIGLNFYVADLPLGQGIRRRIDASVWDWADGRLRAWGELCGGPIARRAEVIDRNSPRLERYDRWGREVNQVVHHPDAIAGKRDLCEAGYTGFSWAGEVRSDPLRREAAAVLGSAFTYMLCESDTGMACACGMTAGVARIVDRFASPDVRERFLPHLTTTSYDDLWDGAMFMTERSGGSDLSNTETTAMKDGEVWLLEGEKWFCSNVDARAILTLARPEGAGAGTKGLGLYLVPSVLDDGTPNSIRIRRIKDKLGTRSVPTGEVIFDRAVAHQLGEPGAGINRMMEMVNVSRLGVALMGAGIARRSVMEAALFASQRETFGRRIDRYPMVRETLVDMQVEAEAALALCLECSAIGGRLDAGRGDEYDEALLRILTPLTKIRAARTGLQNAVEAVEVLGGNGYIEDWPTARQLRDAQCHTIWEGTENVNSLDVLRAMVKAGAHRSLFARIDGIIDGAGASFAEALRASAREAQESIPLVAGAADVHARRFANFLADLVAAALLVEGAAADERSALVASRYLDRHLRGQARLPDVAPYLSDEGFERIVGFSYRG